MQMQAIAAALGLPAEVPSKHAEADAGLEAVFTEELMKMHPGVSWDAIVAVEAQMFSNRVRCTAKSEIRKLVDKCSRPGPPYDASLPIRAVPLRYFDGSPVPNLFVLDGRVVRQIPPGFPVNSIFNVAGEAGYSPYMLARAVLQQKFASHLEVSAAKSRVKTMLKDLTCIEDEFLRREIEDAQAVDRHYSPGLDLIRHNIGFENEFRLQRHLQAIGVAFETERELDAKGFPKTPDIRLPVPMGVRRGSDIHVVHWIDSKAMFGVKEDANDNIAQLQGYVNRFGPGMVIYWMGHHPALTIPHVLVTDSFPEDVVLIE